MIPIYDERVVAATQWRRGIDGQAEFVSLTVVRLGIMAAFAKIGSIKLVTLALANRFFQGDGGVGGHNQFEFVPFAVFYCRIMSCLTECFAEEVESLAFTDFLFHVDDGHLFHCQVEFVCLAFVIGGIMS